jgi:hypothetical protein
LAEGYCKFFYANAGGKRPIQLSVQYKQQGIPLLSMHNYTQLLISGNDKKAANITKPTQTCINRKKYVNGSVKFGGTYKKIKKP